MGGGKRGVVGRRLVCQPRSGVTKRAAGANESELGGTRRTLQVGVYAVCAAVVYG